MVPADKTAHSSVRAVYRAVFHKTVCAGSGSQTSQQAAGDILSAHGTAGNRATRYGGREADITDHAADVIVLGRNLAVPDTHILNRRSNLTDVAGQTAGEAVEISASHMAVHNGHILHGGCFIATVPQIPGEDAHSARRGGDSRSFDGQILHLTVQFTEKAGGVRRSGHRKVGKGVVVSVDMDIIRPARIHRHPGVAFQVDVIHQLEVRLLPCLHESVHGLHLELVGDKERSGLTAVGARLSGEQVRLATIDFHAIELAGQEGKIRTEFDIAGIHRMVGAGRVETDGPTGTFRDGLAAHGEVGIQVQDAVATLVSGVFQADSERLSAVYAIVEKDRFAGSDIDRPDGRSHFRRW